MAGHCVFSAIIHGTELALQIGLSLSGPGVPPAGPTVAEVVLLFEPSLLF